MKFLILASNNATDYQIVTPIAAPQAVQYAASELAYFLQEITGVSFPIVEESAAETAHEILVGARQQQYADKMAECEKDGFYLCACACGKIRIGAKSPRGILYGVYTLLEKEFGCRWFTKEVSRIPKRDTLVLDCMERVESPILEYREPFYTEAFDPDWAARNKVNGNTATLEEKHGGKVAYGTFVHSFERFLPVSEFFDIHPEYYSEIDGKRTNQYTQLCLSNPEVLEIMIARVKKAIAENPEATIFSVSQNDCYNPCQCEKCRKIDEEEGSHAGTLLRFVNAVAEAVEKDYPHVLIDTLAYQYTRSAPKITKPRSNVIVRLCSIECCFTHPLGTCDHARMKTDENNHTFLEDLEDWSKICDRLYIWDYVVNFANYLMPYPNTEILKANVNFFINHHVKGIFEEGGYAFGGGAYCAELNSYLLAKIMWDPEADDTQILEEFLCGVYGMAAPVMKRIFAAYRNWVIQENYHMEFAIDFSKMFTSSAFLAEQTARFEEAKRLAEEESVLRQVRKAELWNRYLVLGWTPKSDERDSKIEEFWQDCKSYGIVSIREGIGTTEDSVATMKAFDLKQ